MGNNLPVENRSLEENSRNEKARVQQDNEVTGPHQNLEEPTNVQSEENRQRNIRANNFYSNVINLEEFDWDDDDREDHYCFKCSTQKPCDCCEDCGETFWNCTCYCKECKITPCQCATYRRCEICHGNYYDCLCDKSESEDDSEGEEEEPEKDRDEEEKENYCPECDETLKNCVCNYLPYPTDQYICSVEDPTLDHVHKQGEPMLECGMCAQVLALVRQTIDQRTREWESTLHTYPPIPLPDRLNALQLMRGVEGSRRSYDMLVEGHENEQFEAYYRYGKNAAPESVRLRQRVVRREFMIHSSETNAGVKIDQLVDEDGNIVEDRSKALKLTDEECQNLDNMQVFHEKDDWKRRHSITLEECGCNGHHKCEAHRGVVCIQGGDYNANADHYLFTDEKCIKATHDKEFAVAAYLSPNGPSYVEDETYTHEEEVKRVSAGCRSLFSARFRRCTCQICFVVLLICCLLLPTSFGATTIDFGNPSYFPVQLYGINDTVVDFNTIKNFPPCDVRVIWDGWLTFTGLTTCPHSTDMCIEGFCFPDDSSTLYKYIRDLPKEYFPKGKLKEFYRNMTKLIKGKAEDVKSEILSQSENAWNFLKANAIEIQNTFYFMSNKFVHAIFKDDFAFLSFAADKFAYVHALWLGTFWWQVFVCYCTSLLVGHLVHEGKIRGVWVILLLAFSPTLFGYPLYVILLSLELGMVWWSAMLFAFVIPLVSWPFNILVFEIITFLFLYVAVKLFKKIQQKTKQLSPIEQVKKEGRTGHRLWFMALIAVMLLWYNTVMGGFFIAIIVYAVFSWVYSRLCGTVQLRQEVIYKDGKDKPEHGKLVAFYEPPTNYWIINFLLSMLTGLSYVDESPKAVTIQTTPFVAGGTIGGRRPTRPGLGNNRRVPYEYPTEEGQATGTGSAPIIGAGIGFGSKVSKMMTNMSDGTVTNRKKDKGKEKEEEDHSNFLKKNKEWFKEEGMRKLTYFEAAARCDTSVEEFPSGFGCGFYDEGEIDIYQDRTSVNVPHEGGSVVFDKSTVKEGMMPESPLIDVKQHQGIVRITDGPNKHVTGFSVGPFILTTEHAPKFCKNPQIEIDDTSTKQYLNSDYIFITNRVAALTKPNGLWTPNFTNFVKCPEKGVCTVFGYDKNGVLKTSTAKFAAGLTPNERRFWASTTSGMSGGLIFLVENNQMTTKVIGIHHGKQGNANVFFAITPTFLDVVNVFKTGFIPDDALKKRFEDENAKVINIGIDQKDTEGHNTKKDTRGKTKKGRGAQKLYARAATKRVRPQGAVIDVDTEYEDFRNNMEEIQAAWDEERERYEDRKAAKEAFKERFIDMYRHEYEYDGDVGTLRNTAEAIADQMEYATDMWGNVDKRMTLDDQNRLIIVRRRQDDDNYPRAFRRAARDIVEEAHCTTCNPDFPQGSKFCSGCGRPAPKRIVVCPEHCKECGAKTNAQPFCAKCGTRTHPRGTDLAPVVKSEGNDQPSAKTLENRKRRKEQRINKRREKAAAKSAASSKSSQQSPKKDKGKEKVNEGNGDPKARKSCERCGTFHVSQRSCPPYCGTCKKYHGFSIACKQCGEKHCLSGSCPEKGTPGSSE